MTRLERIQSQITRLRAGGTTTAERRENQTLIAGIKAGLKPNRSREEPPYRDIVDVMNWERGYDAARAYIAEGYKPKV